MEEQIKARLEELRVGLQNDGGDMELVKIDGKVVWLRLVGQTFIVPPSPSLRARIETVPSACSLAPTTIM